MKITYLGKDINTRRDRAGRYALTLWNREVAKCRKVKAEAIYLTKHVLAPMALVVLIGIIYGLATNEELVAKNAFADTTPNKITKLQDEVLTALAKCESGNAPKASGLIHLDNNKAGTLPFKDIPSLGAYQMKVSFVQDFEYRRSHTLLTNYEATLLALDPVQAQELARYAIFETSGGIFRWSCGAPLVDKVATIKSIME